MRSLAIMDALQSTLGGYLNSGFATLVVVTVVLGSVPWIALWLDSKLEKLALREILAELGKEVGIN